MELFKSGNPTLTQKIFDKSYTNEAELNGVMSVRGTINKFGFLMLMVVGGAAFNWHLFDEGKVSLCYTLMLVGLFGGMALGFAQMFKPIWTQYISPAYAILQGFLLGGLSALINAEFSKNYPNIITQAVGLTFGVALAMFLLYNFRIIKPTERLRSIIYTATAGIAIFYLIDMVLFYVFHIDIPITSWENSSWVSIGFSLFVIGIAALKLIVDLGTIEQLSEQGAPKYMEWYGAFGLLVTIVWLYIEILKLLSRFAKRN